PHYSHAFIGSYTARFWPDQPVSCPCGAPLQTVEHGIASCPLHAAARREHLYPIDTITPSPSYWAPSKETQVCARPRRVWEPR
ncbi:hypothetical protein BJV78DRAFT_1368967, partial [Lactifluus subvellereus]